MKHSVRFFLLSLIFSLCGFAYSAATTASGWTLSSMEFSYKQQGKTDSKSKITQVLPQLILEQIADNSLRLISPQEDLDRQLYELQTERLSLFLQLSKENKTRDALVLSKDNPRALRKAIIESEEKIAEIKAKIDENLLKKDEITKKYEKKINPPEKEEKEEKHGFAPFPFPFFHDEEDRPVSETVSLYKNDSSALFSPSENAKTEGISSYTFEKEVTNAKINGLLTGDILIFGDYASVTVNLYVFPGAKCTGTVTEVGNTSDLIAIAQSVVRNLTPKIANSLPVKIRFDIKPEEAASNAVVSVDGVVISSKKELELIIDAGIHSITIGAKDYDSQSITYQFSGDDLFTVRTTLKPLVSGKLNIRLKKLKDGIFYFNGNENAHVDGENMYGEASVNGKTILGKFTRTEDNESAFILIPESIAKDGNHLLVNAKPYDRAKNIDKRRRRMYTAYSALICSLPVTFFCVGNFNSATNAYNADRGTYDDALKWQKRAYGSIGVSCVAGGWFVFEMVRYLFAANEVLPASAKPDKSYKEDR